MVKRFIAHLHTVSDRRKSNIFSYDEIREEAERVIINFKNIGEFIELLNTQNYIIKKGPKLYQLLSSSF
jgi:DNA helicase MCM8